MGAYTAALAVIQVDVELLLVYLVYRSLGTAEKAPLAAYAVLLFIYRVLAPPGLGLVLEAGPRLAPPSHEDTHHRR